ncbi:MAG: GDSL-type esterase/lipase family protein, partial [Actinomycetota bacterium]|nr:GDSL-type esterase/lipase family protein [Actinomycetota bacterium]
NRLDLPSRTWAVATFVGAVCAAVGVWLVVGLVGDWFSFIMVVTLSLVASGMWFVFRGEGLVFLVLAGFVLVWALQERNGDTLPILPEGTQGVLAFGDSFMSGEGAPTFLAGTNTKGEDGNTCRRSDSSYAALSAASASPPMQLHSFACSGAEIADVLSEGQKRNVGSDVAGWLPQLVDLEAPAAGSDRPAFISPADLDTVEVVLVSVGGNDTGFSTIITACLLPANCADDAVSWFAKAESLEPELVAAYQAIDEATGSAQVVVVPYPLFVDATDCGKAVSIDEYRFVVEFIGVLNNTIMRAANEAGVMVADTTRAFDGHRQCDPEPAANLVVLAPPSGPVGDRLNPATWTHGSMHPN